MWNCITSTEIKKIECLQCKFIAQCQYHFPNYDHVTDLDFLQFQEDFIFIHYFFCCLSDLKCCPSVLHAPVVPLLPHNSRNSSLFTANYKILHQLDIFLLVTFCVQIVDNFWKHVTFQKKIYALLYQIVFIFLCSKICLSI